MSNIQIQCKTNLDRYKHQKWPTSLPAVPRRGQRVAAESGLQLTIVSMAWLYDGTLEIELHLALAGTMTMERGL